MKFYVGSINNLHGDMEVETTVRFGTDGNPAEYLDQIASTFWGVSVENDDYWDFSNGISTQPAGFKEVSEEVFYALSGVVTHL